MARVCELTGKRPMVGNNVSHANNRTKRRQMPNLQEKTYASDVLGENVKLRLSTCAIRTIDKFGGLDMFMKNVKNRRTEVFSLKATRLRKAILKADKGESTPAAN